MKKFIDYQYKVGFWNGRLWHGWFYLIYTLDEPPLFVRESSELFATRALAEFAATGHITLLEKGETVNAQDFKMFV